MKPTPLQKLYKAPGFANPGSHRVAQEFTEKLKQTVNERHSFFDAECGYNGLKSRKSFLNAAEEPPNGNLLMQKIPSASTLKKHY